MTKRFRVPFRRFPAASLLLLAATPCLAAGPSPAAIATFNHYSQAVESRLATQHRSQSTFLNLADSGSKAARLRRGEVIIEQLTPEGEDLPGAMLHHWRGTAFAPGATAADFVHLMQNYNGYPRYFAPQVLQARALTPPGDHMQAWMRVRQKHVLTVVMDTAYDVSFGQLDPELGYSISRSTRIDEIGSPGTASEHVLPPGEEHGFLWRLNTYWSYEQRDGGLYLQIETVSLTRSVPFGLGWAIGPYVESVPRESLEFTLHATCNALKNATRNSAPGKVSQR